MPGADWIGPARVGRVGSGRLGRGLEPACAGKGPSRAAAPARCAPGSRGRPRPVSRLALLPLSSACLGPRGGRLAGREPLPALTGAESPWRNSRPETLLEGPGARRAGGTPSWRAVSERLPSPSAATAHLPSRPVSSRLPRCDLRGRPALAGQGEEKWFQYANLGGRGSRRASPVTSPLFPGASGPPLPRPCLPSLQL